MTGVLRGPQDQPDRRGLVADLAVCAGGEGGDRPFKGDLLLLIGAINSTYIMYNASYSILYVLAYGLKWLLVLASTRWFVDLYATRWFDSSSFDNTG